MWQGRVAFHSVTAHRSLPNFLFPLLVFVIDFSLALLLRLPLWYRFLLSPCCSFFSFDPSPPLPRPVSFIPVSSASFFGPLMVVWKSWLWDRNGVWGFVGAACRCVSTLLSVLSFLLWHIFLVFCHNDLYWTALVKMWLNTQCCDIVWSLNVDYPPYSNGCVAVHTVYSIRKALVPLCSAFTAVSLRKILLYVHMPLNSVCSNGHYGIPHPLLSPICPSLVLQRSAA